VPTPFNKDEITPQQYIAYLDLSGGRNTKRDPHALDRNMLVQSDNTWMAQGNTIAKRPGNTGIAISAYNPNGMPSLPYISQGAVGSSVPYRAMAEGRFFETTALVVLGTDSNIYAAPVTNPAVSTTPAQWQKIGAATGATYIQAAQLFDPDPTQTREGADGALFITTGVGAPLTWPGPGNLAQSTVLSQLPQKTGQPGNITPQYCATLFSSMFYAGEPTDPCAVYVSNPFQPQQFTINLIAPTPPTTTNTYIPLYAGRGDGIDGSRITGLAPLLQTMCIYKESSIYYMYNVSLVGEMLWAVAIGSASVGAMSPASIVRFDTFHVFLGIDGVYTFDGTNTRKISENNPDLFDGPSALIQNRKTAVAVRYGNRYIIFFDIGLGYPSRGAWFDFGKPDVDGYPAVGTVSNMNVAGIAPLRGPQDYGNFAWASATQDLVGVFGALQSGFVTSSDFLQPITATVQGKADYFADIWGEESVVDYKVVDSIQLLMSLPVISSSQSYTFQGNITYDQSNVTGAYATTFQLPFPGGTQIGISFQIGSSQIGFPASSPSYQILNMYVQQPAIGTIIQFGWTESSIFPWTSLGYTLEANRQPRPGPPGSS
jgi:hypothetical protein